MQFPSTTQILRHFGLTRDYVQFGKPEQMQRGRLVTLACHLIADGKSLDAEGEPAGSWEARHPECVPFIDAYRKFFKEHRVTLLEYEKEYRSEALRFISHPDQIGKLDNFGIVDLELKSGSMPDCCPLQTAGQVLAIGAPTMKRFALQLKDDGTYKLFPHENFRDFDDFRALINAYWVQQSYGVISE